MVARVLPALQALMWPCMMPFQPYYQVASLRTSPLKQGVAAISVGVYKDMPVLDLDYIEDSDCDTDMNVVMTADGGFVGDSRHS